MSTSGSVSRGLTNACRSLNPTSIANPCIACCSSFIRSGDMNPPHTFTTCSDGDKARSRWNSVLPASAAEKAFTFTATSSPLSSSRNRPSTISVRLLPMASSKHVSWSSAKDTGSTSCDWALTSWERRERRRARVSCWWTERSLERVSRCWVCSFSCWFCSCSCWVFVSSWSCSCWVFVSSWSCSC